MINTHTSGDGNRNLPKRVLLIGLFVLMTAPGPSLTAQPADAQPGAGENGDAEQEEKSIEEILENSTRIDGLFTLYRDDEDGTVRMLLSEDELDRDFLYFTYSENGVVAAGRFRGNFGLDRAKIFRITRFFNRVEFIVDNTNFYFDPESAISRAADANISRAVIADLEIEAEDTDASQLLIKADSLFLTDAFNMIAPLPNPERPPHETFRLGEVDASKTKIREVRNYPENTDVIVEYVFKNAQPYISGGAEVADDRFVSLTVQHSLIAAPDDDFEPRFDDPRVGYFTDRVTDLSSTDVTPYHDTIHRWHLVKRNPEAPLSDPVEPIVYWIENTTPMELRPIIEAAALRWNEAFEAAGFTNAIQVRIQPDDADWDAGDLRYNVLRWTSSPRPPFGGYGPSFADPRTGQILGADVMLEYSSIAGRLREGAVFGEALIPEYETEFDPDPRICDVGLYAQQEMAFATAALEAIGADTETKQRLLEEFVYFLTLHEIGHTLGLNHNFRASYLHSLDDIFDPDETYPVGLHGSVMDYPVVPFAMPGEPQGQFGTTRPGPYDRWAIEFGYSPAVADSEAEAGRLEAILARSTEPQLAFSNDADDMRSPGKAIDPRAMVNDMTSDPIGFAAHQIAVVDATVERFDDRLVADGDSYQMLLIGLQVAASRYAGAARAASRYIGGVYVDRAMANQPGAGDPLTPVSLRDQQRAMALLTDSVFAPDAFAALHRSADRLLAQRRGFDHFSRTEDPKFHTLALSIQRDILTHLLHPRVLTRLTDTRIYGNEYSVAQMLTDLTDAVFEQDINGDVNTFRQNLQADYVLRLIDIVNSNGESDYDNVSRAMALDRLRWIESALGNSRRGNAETRAHRSHVLYRIERGLDDGAG